MKQLYDTTKPPLPLFARQEDGSMAPISAWSCAHCGRKFLGEDDARACCLQYCCTTCGAAVPQYWIICPSCRDQEVEDRALVVDYDGGALCVGDDIYDDLEDALENTEAEWAFMCREVKLSDYDPDRIVRHILEDLLGEFEGDGDVSCIVDVAGLEAAVAWWLKMQPSSYTESDNTRKVRLRLSNEEQGAEEDKPALTVSILDRPDA